MCYEFYQLLKKENAITMVFQTLYEQASFFRNKNIYFLTELFNNCIRQATAKSIHYLKSNCTMSKLGDFIVDIFSISIKHIRKIVNINEIIDLISTNKGKRRGHSNKFIGIFFSKKSLADTCFMINLRQ